MEFNVYQINPKYNFTISGSSFIGTPVDGTVLFVTKRVKHLIKNLNEKRNCLVYVENGIEIPDDFKKNNCFIFVDDPQSAYAKFAIEVNKIEKEKERSRKYTLTPEGYYIGENVKIGNNVIIEPCCRIGHDVVIGDNAFIGFGSTIYNAEIGNNFSCLEKVSIGIDAFYMSDNEDNFRIPSFGKVYIGDNVDFSSKITIERGFNSNTIIGSNTKIDSNVCLGHDDVLGDNVTITSGTSIAGLVTVGKNVYIGMNATIKQRLNIGNNVKIGMGAVVIANVKDNITVFGNPAVQFGN